jgi:cell division protein FtsA
MARIITTGIDIGTYQVKVVVTEHQRGNDKKLPKVIGVGLAQSRGLRHGYIINSSDIRQSIRAALTQAEKSAKVRIKRAYLSVGGVGVDEVRSKGETSVSRADSEVTDLDIDKALADAEERVASKIVNRRIMHVIPTRYKIDGREVLGKPYGMQGQKLEVETLFVTCLEQHLNDLIAAVEDCDVLVEDIMASPIAGSLVTLTKAQKIAGCVLANIGAETVSLVVFENNIPISVRVFPIGSTDITNDIALGLQVSLEEAERIKLGAITGASYSKKRLEEIIVARLSDIFELIEAHLKKIGKNGLLPAGIVMTGGGSGIATLEDFARASLSLPSRIASLSFNENTSLADLRGQFRDSSWAVAYGLCIWGLTAQEESLGIRLAKKTGLNVVQWLKQFLP